MDPNDDSYTIDVDFGPAKSFMKYDEDTNRIIYYPDHSVQGSYLISIIVYESETSDKLYNEYSFYIQVAKDASTIDMSNVNTNQWIVPNYSSSSSSITPSSSSSSSSSSSNSTNRTNATKNSSSNVTEN
mmetsp:Transcript_34568/g.25700  ORF Transcript_34568/g.25700 Transcript_34568/m.25700 type:complete len:129 (-) Transcript_34568:2154-2540(-)